MKGVWIALLFLMHCASVSSQANPQLFGFDEVPLSLIEQPGAAVDADWHISLPGLGGWQLTSGVSGITLDELTGTDTEDFNQLFEQRAVQGLGKNDVVYLQARSHIFFAGFRNPKRRSDYYSFGLYGTFFFMNYWPEDLVDLAYYGNAGPENRGRRYQLDHLKQRGEAMAVWHVGWNRRLNKRWNIGVRAKLYKEMVHWSSTSNSGYFVTTDGNNNTVRNTLLADFELRTSGIESFRDIYRDGDLNNSESLTRLVLDRALLGGNFGFGLDFGFTFFSRPDFRIQGSIKDLGVMRHTDGVMRYRLNGAASIEGLEVLLPEDISGALDPWQELLDQVSADLPFENLESPYWSMRPFSTQLGFQRDFGLPRPPGSAKEVCDCDAPDERKPMPEYMNSYGGVLSVLFAPRGPQPGLTAYFTRRIGRSFSLRGTYTVHKFSASNLGLGMEARLGPLQFHLIADNLLGYRNLFDSHTQSVMFGFNLRSGRTRSGL